MIDLPPPLLAEAVAAHLLPPVARLLGVDVPRMPAVPTRIDLLDAIEAVQRGAGRRAAREPACAALVEAAAALAVAVDGADDGACAAVACEAIGRALGAWLDAAG